MQNFAFLCGKFWTRTVWGYWIWFTMLFLFSLFLIEFFWVYWCVFFPILVTVHMLMLICLNWIVLWMMRNKFFTVIPGWYNWCWKFVIWHAVFGSIHWICSFFGVYVCNGCCLSLVFLSVSNVQQIIWLYNPEMEFGSSVFFNFNFEVK